MHKADRLDSLPLGLLAGCLSACAGYVLLGSGWAWMQGEPLAYFHHTVFLDSALFKDRILSVCTLAIVPTFHWAYRRKCDQFARGCLLVMIGIVMVIVWLQMGGA